MNDAIPISFPSDKIFLLNLILQRTKYVVDTGYGDAINEWQSTGNTKRLEELLDNRSWRSGFLNDVVKGAWNDALVIASEIKSDLSHKNICSIGPGNGIVELFLVYKLNPGALLLIDVEKTPGLHAHGFEQSGSGYASLEATTSFIRGNLKLLRPNTLCTSILTVNPQRDYLPNIPIDLCISLLSAGFHYPLDEYLEYFKLNLHDKSELIFDARLPKKCQEALCVKGINFNALEPLLVHSKLSRLHLQILGH